jgi:hypothetical protein
MNGWWMVHKVKFMEEWVVPEATMRVGSRYCYFFARHFLPGFDSVDDCEFISAFIAAYRCIDREGSKTFDVLSDIAPTRRYHQESKFIYSEKCEHYFDYDDGRARSRFWLLF